MSKAKRIVRDLRNFKRAARNSLSLYLISALRKPPYPVHLRSGSKLMIPSRDELFRTIYREVHPNTYFDGNIRKNINGTVVEIAPLNNGDIFRAFVDDDYSDLSVKGKTVVDVGASVGDTAIYFAASGADQVLAYEPYPRSFSRAMENIERNNLEHKIKLLNKGVGKPGSVRVNPLYPNSNSSVLRDSKNGNISIEVISLDSIVEENNLGDAVLKMDCEGCEYDSILKAGDTTLRAFKEIKLEYHHGYKDLKKRLNEVGFKVTCTRPYHMKSRDEKEQGKDIYLGYLKAIRK